jgi:translation initiation factor 1 (eIF-1/SUI1)
MAPKPKLPACGFFVTVNDTDHSVPIRIKKVAKGKRISVVSKITGSRTAAVNTLKQLLGVGGEVSAEQPDAIEIQGDQSGRIATVLRNLGALRGEPVNSGPTVVVPPKQGFEKFMKTDKTNAPQISIPEGEMSKACIIVHGRHWPYCNGNCKLCPPLTDVFEGVDVYCSWYNPDDAAPSHERSSAQIEGREMTKEEISTALGVLGMRAEVGEACRAYEREKNMKPWLLAQTLKKPETVSEKPSVAVPKPKPLRVAKKAPFVDRPVRVILNKPTRQDEDFADYFVMEVSLRDSSQWMSEYEYFVVSFLSETSVILANHEMVDSRTLRLLFFDKANMTKCHEILEEVMPSFFNVTTRDALIEHEDVQDPSLEEVEISSSGETSEPDRSGPLDFAQMAQELGLDANEDFWKRFTELVEEAPDGSEESLLRAFQGAVLYSTGNLDS